MSQGYIAISYACNQKCSFCPCTAEERHYPIPPVNNLKETVINMKKRGIDSLIVSGGEPTLHPEFVDFIGFLCSEGLRVTILSNSERFSDQAFVTDFSYHADPGLVEVITTLHSHNPSEHETINGSPGSFERSVNGLLKLADNGYHITVKHCITKLNCRDLKVFYEYVDDRFPEAADIQMCSIDYCGLTEDNKYDYMVVFPELEPFFEEMFDSYIERVERGNKRHMYCINMPLCSMDPYYWDFVAPKNQPYSNYSSPTENGKSNMEKGSGEFIGTFGKGCQVCKAEPLCAGTYRTAFEYFGDRIILPYE